MVLSIIILERTRPVVEQFIHPEQCGFRRKRGTADAVWAHRMIVSKALKYNTKFHILGLDMSKAFDTVNRSKLLEVLSSFLDSDSIILIRMLMENTTNRIRLENTLGENIRVTHEVPQGDSLSPVLFTIYLKAVLQDLEEELIKRGFDIEIIHYILYADDTDFISLDETLIGQLEAISQTVFAKWCLKVNPLKTEHTVVSKTQTEWHKTRKLGSLLKESEDFCKQKQAAEIVFNQLWFLWKKNNNLPEKLRLRLYKTLVRPVLLYNMNTWGSTIVQFKKLESFERRLLRRVLGIYYPNHLSNEEVYKRSNMNLIRLDAFHARWKLFRKVLQMPDDVPAMYWTRDYFRNEGLSKFKGKPNVTLMSTLQSDLQSIHFPLDTKENLNLLQSIANFDDPTKPNWETLVKDIASQMSQVI